MEIITCGGAGIYSPEYEYKPTKYTDTSEYYEDTLFEPYDSYDSYDSYELYDKPDIYFRNIKKSMSKETLPEFPLKDGVHMKDIQLTEEGKYSYTKRRDGNSTIDFLRKHMGSLKGLTILDGTGNVGGDSILFGLNFKHVDSIEIEKDNFEALKHNVSLYKLSNVEVHNGDSTKLFDRFETDVVYFDPPWGGPDYKTKKDLDLYLGKSRIDLFIKNEILSEKAKHLPKYIVLKLPFNYNWSRLKFIKAIENSQMLKIRNYRILILKVKETKKDAKKETKDESVDKVVSKLIDDGETYILVKKKTRKRSRSRSAKGSF